MIKPVISSLNTISTRKICSLDIETPLLKNLRARVSNRNNDGHEFITEIKTHLNKTLGFETFSMFENSPTITGLYIQVEPEYRSQYHLGELLRLISIIELMENQVKNLKIFSKDSAVFFHAKYKFMPDITQFSERNTALNDIIKNNSPKTKTETLQAVELLKRIAASNSAEEQRKMCKQANEIINSYIKKVFSGNDKEYKKHPFTFGMNMILTRDKIIENKDFFNELFAKHNIDYKI